MHELQATNTRVFSIAMHIIASYMSNPQTLFSFVIIKQLQLPIPPPSNITTIPSKALKTKLTNHLTFYDVQHLHPAINLLDVSSKGIGFSILCERARTKRLTIIIVYQFSELFPNQIPGC